MTREAVREVMSSDRAAIYSVHGDTSCLHVHFEVSTVDSNGKIYAKPFDFRDWEKSMERLEIKYELERVVQRKAMEKDDPRREIKIKAPSRAELEIAVKDGTPSPKMEALRVLDAAKAEAKTMTQFMDMVEANEGYEIVPGSGTSKIAGYSLRCPDGVMIKGSDFGKSYSWGGIVKGGITYEQDRDFAAVDVRRKREHERAFGLHETAGPTLGADRAEPSPNPSSIGPASAPATPTVRGGNGDDPARNPSQSGNRFDAVIQRLRSATTAGKTGAIGNDQPGSFTDDAALRSGSQSGERNERSSDKTSAAAGRNQAASEREPRQPNGTGDIAGLYPDSRSNRGAIVNGAGQGSVRQGHDLGNNQGPERTAKPTAVPRYIAKQIEAWDRQCRALGLTDEDKIRVAVVGRKPGSVSGIPYPSPFSVGMQTSDARKAGEVYWTVSDVRKNIESGRMAAWNRDRDILITPYSETHHYVFVDDTKPDALKKAGYTPCLVQETSKDNYQAVLKVPKSKDDTELVAINRLCLNINRRLGDAGAGYADHSFRLAGFAIVSQGVTVISPRLTCAKANSTNPAKRRQQSLKTGGTRSVRNAKTRTASLHMLPKSASGETWHGSKRTRQTQIAGLSRVP